MKIAFSCPYCGKKLGANETSVGKEKTCPNCRARVKVPSAEEAALKASRLKERREVADHPLLFMGRRPEHKDLIDMTAMVDIVFFLLIFFLVTSMQSIEAVINLPAPQASNAPNSVQAVRDITDDSTYVVVTIDADDSVFVDDEEALSEQDLRSKLRAAHQEHEKDGLMINGAADSTHGKFVMVLDAGADAGMKDIKFSVPQNDIVTNGG
jgi:biopolymer transport protein ExbD